MSILEDLKYEKVQVQVGDLLLAEPFMSDINFLRSVILITEKNKDGYVGFVFNKQIENIRLEDVIDHKYSLTSELYLGGPVEKNLLYIIHSYGDLLEGSLKIADDLYFGCDYTQLNELVGIGLIKPEKLRFFLGYSGWNSKQLEEEVNGNNWIITNSRNYNIFTQDSQKLWQDVLIDMGGKYKMIANFPVDPALN